MCLVETECRTRGVGAGALRTVRGTLSEVVRGDIARFLNGDPTAGAYMTGFFPIMMFALPAAALAATLEVTPRTIYRGIFNLPPGHCLTVDAQGSLRTRPWWRLPAPVQPGRAAGLRRFIEYVLKHDDVWVPRRIDIARHWQATQPPPQEDRA